MSTKQAAYFGLSNCKYAIDGGSPVAMPYAQSLSLNALVSSTPLYADDRKILEVPSDKGYDGTFGLSALDPAYEQALGYTKVLAGGSVATLDAVALKKHHIYFETTGAREDGSTFTIKCWIMGVTTAKSGKNYTTKGEDPEFGLYELPVVIYGEPLLDGDGKAYVDPESGQTRTVFLLTSTPGEDGYETFGDAVPEPKVELAGGGA